jgi:hypothetical protein
MRRLLGIAGLMLMWLFCGTSSAQPMGLAVAKGPPGVTGHGETVDSAKKVAINKAVEEITGFMKRYEFTSFVVTEDYVRKHVLVDPGQPGEDVRVENFPKPFKSWTLTFRNGYSNDLVRRDQETRRKLRADERQNLGSHIVIGLAFLLLAGYGYVRLDEYTQRRYTTWLRLAGIGVAATVIAGWWWVCFQATMAPLAPG